MSSEPATVPEAQPPATESSNSGGAPAAPAKEEIDKSHWVPDKECTSCMKCKCAFTLINRKHHCRQCGMIFCDGCSLFKSTCEKCPEKVDRLCYDCVIISAKAKTGLHKTPEEKINPVEVGVNKEETFEGLFIKGDSTCAAVRGQANAKVNLIGCHVQGIDKGSNGHVMLKDCHVVGAKALAISGNNTITLTNCIVVGSARAVLLAANAKLEATGCYFISTDPDDGIAIECEGNSNARLTDCVVTGADGVILHGNAKLEATKGSISSRALSGALGKFSPHCAIAGKHSIHDGTIVVGAIKGRAGELSALQKIGAKIEPKKKGDNAAPKPAEETKEEQQA